LFWSAAIYQIMLNKCSILVYRVNYNCYPLGFLSLENQKIKEIKR